MVSEVVEKIVISEEATIGIYNFSKGSQFCYFSDYMVKNGIGSNGEVYVAHVYTLMAKKNFKIGVFNTGSEGDGMYGLGIPDDLRLFLNDNISSIAVDF